MRQKRWHSLPLAPAHNAGARCASTTLASSRTVERLCLHPAIVCIHSCIYTWSRHVFIFSVYVCMHVSPHVDALKLHGEDAFHFRSPVRALRCTRVLILPHFTCMHTQPLQAGFVCFSLSCKSPHTNARFLSCCNKGHISSLYVYIVFVQVHFICFSTEICCAAVLPLPACTHPLPW